MNEVYGVLHATISSMYHDHHTHDDHLQKRGRRTKRSTQAADSVLTYINIKRGGWVTANVRRQTMTSKTIAGLPEAIIPNCMSLMIAGVLGCFITAQFGGFGILTFVQVATLGVSAASLCEYQTDRGLWMFALLMLVIWGGLYALGLTMQTLDMLKGVQSPVAILIDASLATFCTTIHLRFLWRVALYNFQHAS